MGGSKNKTRRYDFDATERSARLAVPCREGYSYRLTRDIPNPTAADRRSTDVAKAPIITAGKVFMGVPDVVEQLVLPRFRLRGTVANDIEWRHPEWLAFCAALEELPENIDEFAWRMSETRVSSAYALVKALLQHDPQLRNVIEVAAEAYRGDP